MECQQNLMEPLKKIQRTKIGTMKQSKTVKIDEPDGRLAWGVAFAACLINFIMAGLGRMSGILYVAFIEMFNIGRGQAMMPFGVRSSTRNLLGPIVGILGQEYGVRAVSVMGGVIGTLSSAACFFAPDMTWITIIWGGINGIGTALTTTLPQVTVGQYFKKYHTTAAGLAFSGGCVGAFLFPALIEYLLHSYGLQGTFLIMAAITMHVIPASMILRKPPWMKSRNNSRASVSAIETSGAETNGIIEVNGGIRVNGIVKENGIPRENYIAIESDVTFRNLENNQENHSINNTRKSISFKNNERLFSDILSEAIQFLQTSSKYSFNNSNQFNNTTSNNELPHSTSILNFLYKLYDSEGNQGIVEHGGTDNTEIEESSEIPQSKSLGDVIESAVLEFKKDQTMEEFFLHLKVTNSNLLDSQTLEELQFVILEIAEQVEHRKLESENGHVLLNLDETATVINSDNHAKSSGFMEHIKTAIKLNSNPIFHLICLCRTIHFISFIPVVTVVVDFGMDKGLPEEDGKYIIAALSAGDLVGRLGLGWVTDKGYIVLPKYMLLGMIIQGATTAALPFVNTKWVFLCAIGVFGMLQGSLFIRHPVLVSRYMGSHEQPIAMGCINFLSGFVGFGLPAYIGYFRDTLGSYDHMFHITGALGTFVGFLWIFEPQFAGWISSRRRVDSAQER